MSLNAAFLALGGAGDGDGAEDADGLRDYREYDLLDENQSKKVKTRSTRFR